MRYPCDIKLQVSNSVLQTNKDKGESMDEAARPKPNASRRRRGSILPGSEVCGIPVSPSLPLTLMVAAQGESATHAFSVRAYDPAAVKS